MSRQLQQKCILCLQTWSFEIFSRITRSGMSPPASSEQGQPRTMLCPQIHSLSGDLCKRLVDKSSIFSCTWTRAVISKVTTDIFFPLTTPSGNTYLGYNGDFILVPLLKMGQNIWRCVSHRLPSGFCSWFFVNVLAPLELDSPRVPQTAAGTATCPRIQSFSTHQLIMTNTCCLQLA